MNDQTIVVTGFMGTGKSTTALELARLLQRPLIDMDTLIEQRTGWTIPRLFAERGEPFFRAIEHGLCLELSLRTGLVVATGGGALMNSHSQEVFEQVCFLVCLMARPDTIEARLEGADNRPLVAHWQELLKKRTPIYEGIAYRVWTDDKTPKQVAEEIVSLWNASQ